MKNENMKFFVGYVVPRPLKQGINRAVKSTGWNQSMILRAATEEWLAANGYLKTTTSPIKERG